MNHRTARQLLLAYHEDSLDADRRNELETHLQGCASCTDTLNTIREIGELFVHSPGDALPETYWDTLVRGTMERIRAEQVPAETRSNLLREVLSMVRTIPRPAIAVALGAAFCVLFLVFRPGENHTDRQPALVGSRADSVALRTDRYLRRSQALLVGLANMKTPEDQPIDLTAERKLSRSLIRESRILKREPLDPVSAQIVCDIEPILVQIANVNPRDEQPAVHLVRTGIFERNLLFKVRMASVLRDSTLLATIIQ